MKCAECVLWWVDEGEVYPTCHAVSDWPAPCEQEDDYEEVVDDDYEPDWEMLEEDENNDEF